MELSMRESKGRKNSTVTLLIHILILLFVLFVYGLN